MGLPELRTESELTHHLERDKEKCPYLRPLKMKPQIFWVSFLNLQEASPLARDYGGSRLRRSTYAWRTRDGAAQGGGMGPAPRRPWKTKVCIYAKERGQKSPLTKINQSCFLVQWYNLHWKEVTLHICLFFLQRLLWEGKEKNRNPQHLRPKG